MSRRARRFCGGSRRLITGLVSTVQHGEGMAPLQIAGAACDCSRSVRESIANLRHRLWLFVLFGFTVAAATVHAQSCSGDSFRQAPSFVANVLRDSAHHPIAASELFNSRIGVAARQMNDSTTRRASRSTHVETGALAGAGIGGFTGVVLGIVVDQGSNPHWQVHGAWIALGIEGAAVGAIVGSLIGVSLPHS